MTQQVTRGWKCALLSSENFLPLIPIPSILLVSFLLDLAFGERIGTKHLVEGGQVGPGERTAILKSSFTEECWQGSHHFRVGEVDGQGLQKKQDKTKKPPTTRV